MNDLQKLQLENAALKAENKTLSDALEWVKGELPTIKAGLCRWLCAGTAKALDKLIYELENKLK